ncbi:MAG TPA: DUF1501 domain-containing protein [Candidatus Binatia bacterium]|nr:DUF1501 domain-containing protein [Candidatus Binatia bacterium]
MERRALLTAGIALAAFSVHQAARAAAGRRALVIVNQRGAFDGIGALVPHADPDYYALRPTIAVARPNAAGGAIDLDGFFGLHPSLAPLKSLWDAREMAVVHATGLPSADRSHFNAQALTEQGRDAGGHEGGGWAGRLLEATGGIGVRPLRGISISTALDEVLTGSGASAAISDSRNFTLTTRFGDPWQQALHDLHADLGDIAAAGRGVLEIIELLRTAKPYDLPVDNGAVYDNDQLGYGLMQAAQYIKADVGLEVFAVNVGGWDLHASQATLYPPLLGGFARNLAAFRQDLGARFADVTLVTMSEFGRCVAENASGGTDHGHGNAMLVMGGAVNGGRVYARWPHLSTEHQDAGGDLAITTDYRDVIGDIVAARFDADPAAIFPGHAYRAVGLMR